MAVGSARGRFGRPAPQTAQNLRIPAPVGGIDSRVAISAGDTNFCPYTYNLVPYEQGMKVRKGYREWALDTLELDTPVNTIIPFEAVDSSGVNDKLFVVNRNGIYDASTFDSDQVLKLAFAETPEIAGHGIYCHYTGNDEKDVLMYADSVNGLFTYDALSETWAQAANITGVEVADINFVTLHKDRLWFLTEGSTVGYYLEVGAVAGEATKFYFGSKFRHGGEAKGLFSWSVDGGAGVDDILVAVSRSGDVIAFKGDDPTSADSWTISGQYYIGEIPKGVRFGSEYGGDLYLLSLYGLTSMNNLLAGVDSLSTRASADNTSPSAKITSLIRQELDRTRGLYGWSVQLAPSEGSIIISVPQLDNGAFIQFVYNVATAAWGMYRDVPITAFDTWQNRVVFGTRNNVVMSMDVTVDDLKIAPPVGEEFNGKDIAFSMLTSSMPLTSEGLFKRVNNIRTDFRAYAPPTVETSVQYDFNINEASLSSNDNIPTAGGRWSVDAWDIAVWGFNNLEGYNKIKGSTGVGRYCAIAMRGECRVETYFVGFDISVTTGGFL